MPHTFGFYFEICSLSWYLFQLFSVLVTPVISGCVRVCGCVFVYLGVEWRRQISELCDVRQQRSLIISVHIRPITALQAVAPLCL